MSDLSFIVVMGASRPNKLMPLYLEQLRAAGIEHEVETVTMNSPNDGTLGRCLTDWRRLAERFSSFDRLILTDAWDVLCYATKEEIAGTLSGFPESPVFAGEKNCYPEASVAALVPDRGLWRFVNGGMLTASPAGLLDWCASVERHINRDMQQLNQQWLNRRLADDDPIAQIDSRCALFQCMYLDEGEVAVRDGRPYNTMTGTWPRFLHFNGSWPYEPFLEMMEATKALEGK